MHERVQAGRCIHTTIRVHVCVDQEHHSQENPGNQLDFGWFGLHATKSAQGAVGFDIVSTNDVQVGHKDSYPCFMHSSPSKNRRGSNQVQFFSICVWPPKETNKASYFYVQTYQMRSGLYALLDLLRDKKGTNRFKGQEIRETK